MYVHVSVMSIILESTGVHSFPVGLPLAPIGLTAWASMSVSAPHMLSRVFMALPSTLHKIPFVSRDRRLATMSTLGSSVSVNNPRQFASNVLKWASIGRPRFCMGFQWVNHRPPPKTSHFLQRTFHGCSTQARILLKEKYSYIFLCAKVYRSTTSGCRGTPYFRIVDRELVLKPAISFEKSWGELP